MILVTRRRYHPPTIDHIDRRTHDGKTSREAIRCLKRYLARNSTDYSRTRQCQLDFQEASLAQAKVPRRDYRVVFIPDCLSSNSTLAHASALYDPPYPAQGYSTRWAAAAAAVSR
jgi:hypothetical protein